MKIINSGQLCNPLTSGGIRYNFGSVWCSIWRIAKRI